MTVKAAVRSVPRRKRGPIWVVIEAMVGLVVLAPLLLAVVGVVTAAGGMAMYATDLVANWALQIVVAGGVAGLLMCVVKLRGAGVAVLLVSGLLAAMVMPSYRGAEEAGAAGGEVLRVVSYNTRYRSKAENFVEWVLEEEPHLIVLLEAPGAGLEREPRLRERYEVLIEPVPGMQWPVHVLSRIGGEVVGMRERSREFFQSFSARRNVRFAWGGSEVLLTAVHFASPRSVATWRQALGEVERDSTVIGDYLASHPGSSVVVMSDVNSTPTAAVHRRFERMSGLRGWAEMFSGTWPAWLPRFAGVAIDRAWTSEGLRVVRMEVGPRDDSDHRPILVDIEVVGGAEDGLEGVGDSADETDAQTDSYLWWTSQSFASS